MLLGRPDWHKDGIETVNDLDGLISNFWRSIQADPEQTAHYADFPVNEADLTARHLWLVQRKSELLLRLEADPEYYDPKIAGYWVWGIAAWIGSGWCSGKGPWKVVDGRLVKGDAGIVISKLPQLANAGKGVNRQGIARCRPNLRNAGQGINRSLPHLRNAGRGVNRKSPEDGGIYSWFEALSERLRRVRVCCGDWKRVLGPSPTFKLGLTGVFLDPPYSLDERAPELYNVESDVAAEVATWARENGDNPLLRIALCGYAGEHEMPESWSVYSWKAAGGYGSLGEGRARENAKRETIWFSPHCLKHEQLPLKEK